MNGLVILNKPKGCSSHKMVGMARRLFGMKKIGHTGTLDPAATGVLPLLLGKATRASELITAKNKRYTAEILLGTVTDSLDLDGKIIAQNNVNVTEEQIKTVISSFVGEIEQLPPMYSAISVGGQRLYDLARQGIEIEREKRKITVYEINILKIELPKVTIDVSCSKGTYIRTLGADIGEALGCGACLSGLCRTQSGELKIENAFTPEELEIMAKENRLMEAVIPIDKMFTEYGEIALDKVRADRVKNGVPIYFNEKPLGESYRVYDEEGEFIALAKTQIIEDRKCLKTFKAFY